MTRLNERLSVHLHNFRSPWFLKFLKHTSTEGSIHQHANWKRDHCSPLKGFPQKCWHSHPSCIFASHLILRLPCPSKADPKPTTDIEGPELTIHGRVSGLIPTSKTSTDLTSPASRLPRRASAASSDSSGVPPLTSAGRPLSSPWESMITSGLRGRGPRNPNEVNKWIRFMRSCSTQTRHKRLKGFLSSSLSLASLNPFSGSVQAPLPSWSGSHASRTPLLNCPYYLMPNAPILSVDSVQWTVHIS